MSFSHILGQERVIEILKRLFAGNRFPQGLLFYGPSGVGKRTTALELAKALNCLSVNGKQLMVNDFPCDTCLSCQKIDKGIHPDVRIISPEKETIGIDQIRELNRDSQWKPFEGSYKVYILEKTEKLTQEAANSFLKTLEEPPPQVLFVLISENKDTLLPTILSRCWVLPFSGLSEKVIGGILQRSIFNYPQEILPSEYFFAGRMQEIIFNEDFSLLYQKIETFWQNMFSFTEVEMLSLSEEYSKDKEKTGKFLTLLLLFARSRKYWQAVEFINQTKNQIQRNLNRQLALDCLLLKLKSLCR
ncbi:MAG TPA: DNA polymerase III subunit delta' [Elusimicrobia bacterium]|jgi:DNA polymerase-3 subunit delta'|nr:DNA polymerase III subunit delta' [Elusimicrobiota bacterium]